jgi:S-DNA-T family DNA segregation ATPase FtsK/SpoIIIE
MASKRPAKKREKQPFQETTAVRGLAMCSTALALFLSLLSFAYDQGSHNWIGLVGFSIGKLMHLFFGIGSYILCGYVLWVGWRLLFYKPIHYPKIKTLYVLVLTLSLCILLSLIEDHFPKIAHILTSTFYPEVQNSPYHLGGALFYYLYHDIPAVSLIHIFNTTGVALLAITTFTASLLFLTKTKPATVMEKLITFCKSLKPEDTSSFLQEEKEAVPEEESQMRFVKLRIPDAPSQQAPNAPKEFSSHVPQELLAIQPDIHLTARPSLSQKEKTERKRPGAVELLEEELPAKKKPIAKMTQRVYQGDFTRYKMPSTDLLTPAKKWDQSTLKQDLRRQAEVLEETLQSFGIEAKVGQINCGPTITSFEVHPAIGVKVQKIKALENDIALNMEAKSIRIIAPIPGKAAVGIEVPNAQPQEVGFKDMLSAYQQGNRKFHVPILLGKAVNGDYVMNDLTKMPHCIIAGATGSGKSVCINTIVMSIVMNAKPDEIKLIMVDPKKVELTPYTHLPHMLAPVITEPLGACAALNWLVKEMENRYEILKQLGVRNIETFNGRALNKELEASLELAIPAQMPYIVVIIDELADLMMVSSNDIETPIARIAQMARAVGIHLILATQRPSREVITGLIKANFPTRISFKVASRVNSQIVLDETGAECLLGNGDMLFLPPGTSTLVRAQGAFIRDEDIAAVVKQICDQAPPNYVIASFDAIGRQEEMPMARGEVPSDALYDQALETVLSTGKASTTFLQRKLQIGYARAASLMDQMESFGVVGPADGSRARKVLHPSLKERETAEENGEEDLFDEQEEEF